VSTVNYCSFSTLEKNFFTLATALASWADVGGFLDCSLLLESSSSSSSSFEEDSSDPLDSLDPEELRLLLPPLLDDDWALREERLLDADTELEPNDDSDLRPRLDSEDEDPLSDRYSGFCRMLLSRSPLREELSARPDSDLLLLLLSERELSSDRPELSSDRPRELSDRRELSSERSELSSDPTVSSGWKVRNAFSIADSLDCIALMMLLPSSSLVLSEVSCDSHAGGY